MGATQLELLGGFQDSAQGFDYDSDSTDLDFAELETTRGAYQYTSELQWSGMVGERLEWQTGGLFARERGYRRLSLETGSGPAFEPALALYRRRGFADGGPFGDYTKSAFNQFLHLDFSAP